MERRKFAGYSRSGVTAGPGSQATQRYTGPGENNADGIHNQNMVEFAEMISSCRRGETTLEQLEAAVDQRLATDPASAGDLLFELQVAHASDPLPPELFNAIETKLAVSAGERTVARAADDATRIAPAADEPPSATVRRPASPPQPRPDSRAAPPTLPAEPTRPEDGATVLRPQAKDSPTPPAHPQDQDPGRTVLKPTPRSVDRPAESAPAPTVARPSPARASAAASATRPGPAPVGP